MQNESPLPLLEKVSSYTRLRCVMAWIFRYIKNCRQTGREKCLTNLVLMNWNIRTIIRSPMLSWSALVKKLTLSRKEKLCTFSWTRKDCFKLVVGYQLSKITLLKATPTSVAWWQSIREIADHAWASPSFALWSYVALGLARKNVPHTEGVRCNA